MAGQMRGNDKDYYLNRAESELRLAEGAIHEKAAWAHFQLAGRYFDLAYGDTRMMTRDAPHPIAVRSFASVSSDDLRIFAADLWTTVTSDRESA